MQANEDSELVGSKQTSANHNSISICDKSVRSDISA